MTTEDKGYMHVLPFEGETGPFVGPLLPGPKLPELVKFPKRLSASEVPARREIRLFVAGANAVIPYIFGPCLLQEARIYAIKQSGSYLYIGILWGWGEVESINGFYVGGSLFTGQVTHYKGEASQTVNAQLAAAISGYTDSLDGLCHSVVRLTEDDLDGATSFALNVNGQELYDPRTTNTVGTKNPALMFNHIASQTGLVVDTDSIEDAADYCDETVGSYKRWEIGQVFDKPQSIDRVLALLAEYAGCFYVRTGGSVKLVPDNATATTHSFSDEQTDIDAGASLIVANSVKLRKKALNQLPNQTIVEWTNTKRFPWDTASAYTPDPVSALPSPTTFRMDGFRTFNHAKRYAVERQNGFNLCDLEIELEAFDEALSIETGDVIEVTHNIGLGDKKFRVIDVQAGNEIGHWNIVGLEYDPAKNSNTIQVEPTYDDIDLPNPGEVPAGPTPTLTEKLFVDEGGKTFSRFQIAWTGVDWPFAKNYRIRVTAGADVIMENNVTHLGVVSHTAATPPVKQDLSYKVQIWTVNVFGKSGTVAGEASAVALGKLLLPTAPTNAQGFEAGQFVNLQWGASIDIDLVGYRIKRIPESDYLSDVAGAWDHSNAVLLADRHDALRILINAQPVGTFYYMVKAIDSLDQVSDSATAPYGRADAKITVTADGAGGTVFYELDADTLVNMHKVEVHGDAVYYITSEHDTWLDQGAAGTTWADLGSAGTSWFDLNSGAASSLETDEWDITADKEANWTYSAEIETLAGTVTQTIEVSKDADYPTFTSEPGNSFVGELRYLKAKIACTGAAGDGMKIKMPILATYQGKIIVDRQELSVTATQPYSLVFNKNFTSIPDVTLLVKGTAFRTVTVDNLDADGADVYAWDDSASPAITTIQMTATGT